VRGLRTDVCGAVQGIMTYPLTIVGGGGGGAGGVGGVAGGGAPARLLTIDQVTREALGSRGADMFECEVIVTTINHDNTWMYEACPKEDCKKKVCALSRERCDRTQTARVQVVADHAGGYRCEKCSQVCRRECALAHNDFASAHRLIPKRVHDMCCRWLRLMRPVSTRVRATHSQTRRRDQANCTSRCSTTRRISCWARRRPRPSSCSKATPRHSIAYVACVSCRRAVLTTVAVSQLFAAPLYNTVRLKVKAKSETYQDQERVRCHVCQWECDAQCTEQVKYNVVALNKVDWHTAMLEMIAKTEAIA
jgi:hypothetical protein